MVGDKGQLFVRWCLALFLSELFEKFVGLVVYHAEVCAVAAVHVVGPGVGFLGLGVLQLVFVVVDEV